ncbi:hypothetical protein PVK06_048401 [Gossypium arboreum]|uniref:Uncharacterized protein n=1 Tax=Gossypium arboreum TaxID=29729 RepID=A0ABR0MHU8_GOSAR|nr:hypothetical protein PVK06_048401 [Gossypium arboreum]
MISHTTSLRSLCNFGLLELHAMSSSSEIKLDDGAWQQRLSLTTGCGGGSHGEIAGMEKKKHKHIESFMQKVYEVSVHSIAAANKNIVDINLVFQGQLLNIPSSSLLDTQLDRAKKSRLWQSIRALKAPSGQKFFTMITSHCLSNAKSTGYFLVLVPLIAFCIGCIISTLHTRVSRSIKHQAADKSQAHHPGAKGRRWKSALSDLVEGDVFDSELGLDSNSTSEDEANIQNEEASEDYGRLEHDYQKFLSECGISKWGYWRGGSPGA